MASWQDSKRDSCPGGTFLICREERPPPPNECLRYDTKTFDGEVPALEIWGMWSTPSLP